MIKKLTILGLSGLLAFATAAPARAEIISYGTSVSAYGTAGYAVISRDLTLGSYGADVLALESFLVERGFMSAVGNGSFSVATRDGVARFQATSGIYPAVGYFGPLTRNYYNAQVGGMQQYQPYYPYGYQYQYQSQTGCPAGYSPISYGGLIGCLPNSSWSGHGTSNDDDEDVDGDTVRLRRFELNDGDDTDLDEGDDRAEVAVATFDVEDGDARVERADFRFAFDGGSRDEDRPWEVFGTARLLADGDEIARVDAGDEDAWDDDDDDAYVLRFEDLDSYVVDEDDQAELTLEIDVQDSVDGEPSWEVSVPDDGIRVTDGDGDSHEIGDEDQTVDIAINGGSGSGNGDASLELDESDEDPTGDLEAFQDRASDYQVAFAFDIEARDGEVRLRELPLTVSLPDGTYRETIDSAYLQIGSTSYHTYSVDTPTRSASVVTFTFGRNDAVIDEDETETAKLVVRFRASRGNFEDGDRIKAYVTSDNAEDIVAEDEDGDEIDADDISGSVTGTTREINVLPIR